MCQYCAGISLDDRPSVYQWAQHLEGRPLAFLDTETSGLDAHAEVVEIALVDLNGHALFHSLVRPQQALPPQAVSIHGITREMLDEAPTLAVLWPSLMALFAFHEIIIYNAVYDLRVLAYSAGKHGLSLPGGLRTHCLMRQFATYAGHKRTDGTYVYQKLRAACATFGLPQGTHRAVADAESARLLFLALQAEGKTRLREEVER